MNEKEHLESKPLTREQIAGAAYSSEESKFIQDTVINEQLLRENLQSQNFAVLQEGERNLQTASLSQDSLKEIIKNKFERISDYRIVPITEQPIAAVAVGVKGRDSARLQGSFTANQQAHGMVGSASHPGLDAKVGTWYVVPSDQVAAIHTVEDMSEYAIFGEHPLFQPRSWVMDDMGGIWLAADSAIHYLATDGTDTLIKHSLFEAPHDISVTVDTVALVCSSLDLVVLLDKNNKAITKVIYLADFSYENSIGLGEYRGEKKRLHYYYSDQKPPETTQTEIAVQEDRNKNVGVPTAMQRLHPNAVLFIDDSSMLISLFNSVELNQNGEVDSKKSGGKIVHLSIVEQESTLVQYLENIELSSYEITNSVTAYNEEATGKRIVAAAYLKDKNDPKRRLVLRQVEKNNRSYLEIETLTELLHDLRNPHGLITLGELDGNMLYGFSNTNTGSFKVFELTESGIATIVFELEFDDATTISKVEGYTGHWIHHPRILKKDNEAILSVYDGKRSGIWLVNLNKKTASFVPTPKEAVIYQTQAYPSNQD